MLPERNHPNQPTANDKTEKDPDIRSHVRSVLRKLAARLSENKGNARSSSRFIQLTICFKTRSIRLTSPFGA